MLASEKVAIAAHMHVLLRRKTGRVTDTEWMAVNLEYALEIVRFARAKADEEGHHELHEWADKLERAALEQPAAAKRPLLQSAAQLLKERAAAPAPAAAPGAYSGAGFGGPGLADSVFAAQRPPKPAEPDAGDGPRYVGGIR